MRKVMHARSAASAWRRRRCRLIDDHLNVGAERVEAAAGPGVEAEDLAAGRGERERHAVLLPVRPEAAPVADESERPHDEAAVELAVVSHDAGEVLLRPQADLSTQNQLSEERSSDH